MFLQWSYMILTQWEQPLKGFLFMVGCGEKMLGTVNKWQLQLCKESWLVILFSRCFLFQAFCNYLTYKQTLDDYVFPSNLYSQSIYDFIRIHHALPLHPSKYILWDSIRVFLSRKLPGSTCNICRNVTPSSAAAMFCCNRHFKYYSLRRFRR